MSTRLALDLRAYRFGADEVADAWVHHAMPAIARLLEARAGHLLVLAPAAEAERLGRLIAPGAEVAVDPAAAVASAVAVPDLGQTAPPTPPPGSRVIGYTEEGRNLLARRHDVPPERVTVVALAGRPEFEQPGDEAAFATLGLPERYVLAPAAPEATILLEAIGRLADAPHLVLTSASLEGATQLRAHADELGIGHRVLIAGHIPSAAAPLVLGRAQAVVDGGRQDGFPLMAAEALAAGTPLVAVADSAAATLAADDAIVARRADPADLAHALERARDARPAPATTGLSWERTAQALLDAVAPATDGRASVRAEPPTVSIVTPSLDMAPFLRETVDSVLGQSYPKIEYLVVDGGSTDGTVELLRGYGDRLRFVSEPDDGQADAINRGFAATHGEVCAFLNADDTYRPGAVARAVQGFRDQPGAGVVYGDGVHVDTDGRELGPYPTQPFSRDALMRGSFICQPAAFVKRAALEQVGPLDTGLEVALDYDLWVRLAERVRFARVEGVLAASRMHPQNKTLSRRKLAYREGIAVAKRHFGYVPLNWLDGYAQFLVDDVDQFFVSSQPSWASRGLALAMGARHNPRQVGRFWGEWAKNAGLRDNGGRWEDGWISRRYVDDVEVPGDARRVRVVGRHQAPMNAPLEVTLHIDGMRVASRQPGSQERFVMVADCPAELRGRPAYVEICANRTWRPRARGDRRRVSCVVEAVEFSA